MSAQKAVYESAWDRTDPREVRRSIRERGYSGYTAGLAPGRVQANICILPKDWAEDFLLFCQRNPKPCPLLSRSDVGSPMLPELGADIDIRTDVPRYQIFRDGQFSEEVTDIREVWRDDLVTFAFGCSFSFEEALQDSGIPLRFLANNNVAGVYVSTMPTQAAGPFEAPLIVTMRSFKPAHAIRAIQITSRFPNVHGAPVHIGDPGLIGVDLSKRYQDVGDPTVGEGEIPVFWACGLTPQFAVMNAKPPFCITHAPSSMLVSDLQNASLAVL
jgi:uncharacterized protein YcsI (UPF0317 family)